ncbi:hypothetical protein E2C01_097638 [Portunus trituberculatus]|uniref:Uncharacterized protein n=1 Tax=Portunus trituberculatus TaxID=210409 RepID=A0A5B7K4Y3_PORTR|nr:hypothetical protein [Portunus trituberculatus]
MEFEILHETSNCIRNSSHEQKETHIEDEIYMKNNNKNKEKERKQDPSSHRLQPQGGDKSDGNGWREAEKKKKEKDRKKVDSLLFLSSPPWYRPSPGH